MSENLNQFERIEWLETEVERLNRSMRQQFTINFTLITSVVFLFVNVAILISVVAW